VFWRPEDPSLYPIPKALPPAPAPHASAAGHKSATPAKPAGAYRPPHARGSATPLHFKREDEGGAAHIAGSSGLFGGNAEVGGLNGIGRGRRREVPGAAPLVTEKSVPGAAPGGGVSLAGVDVEDNNDGLSKTALKNKKKREAAKKAKEAQGVVDGQVDGAQEPRRGNTLAPGGPDQRRQRSRSRGASRNGTPGPQGQYRNHNREGSFDNKFRQPSPGPGQPQRQRSQRQKNPENLQQKLPTQTIMTMPPPDLEISSPVTPGGGGPEEKKQRSLLKKLRAIEDLKMRLANGEKLEDTQMKKIGTEEGVKKELEGLGWRG